MEISRQLLYISTAGDVKAWFLGSVNNSGEAQQLDFAGNRDLIR